MTELPRITTLSTTPPCNVLVEWTDGGKSLVDLSGWIATSGLLAGLKDGVLFASASIGDFGASVEWLECGEDCAIDAVHLRKIADEQQNFGSEDLVRWQAETALSNSEAADFLGVSLSTWKSYRSGAPVPSRVAMVLRAAARDPLLFHAHFRPRSQGRPRRTA